MPVRSAPSAVHLITLAMTMPHRHEVIAFLTDPWGDGCTVSVVESDGDPDFVLAVASLFARSGNVLPFTPRLVLASVRPDEGERWDDPQRFHELVQRAEDGGVVLAEWFVVSPGGVLEGSGIGRAEPSWPDDDGC